MKQEESLDRPSLIRGASSCKHARGVPTGGVGIIVPLMKGKRLMLELGTGAPRRGWASRQPHSCILSTDEEIAQTSFAESRPACVTEDR